MNEAPSAMQYWQSELANKEEGTKQRYQECFNETFSQLTLLAHLRAQTQLSTK